MATDLSSRGICSVVQCSTCPLKLSDLCAGCRERDAECNVAAISHDLTGMSRNLIRRFARYLLVAEHGRSLGKETVTSSEFASALGIKPELVRKDFTSLGHFGIRHVGYKLDMCIEALRITMNLQSIQNIVWIGLEQPYSPRRLIKRLNSFGCRVVAILNDVDKGIKGEGSIEAVRIFDFDEIERIVVNLAVIGAIIACSNDQAQTAVDKLMELGIRSILNLTPVPLDHPENVFIRNIDISEDIMLFSFYCGAE